jgi:Cytidylate kinase-like family
MAMSLVTLSASYGAGGSLLGPRLAERLGVPFLDRAIPAAVARRLAVPIERALHHDESVGTVLERFVGYFVMLPPFAPAAEAAVVEVLDPRAYQRETEQIIHERAREGAGVILGRAAQVILRDDPRALHVRLDGPPERRVLQAMRMSGLDHDEAERRLCESDRAREAYGRHFYRTDPRDPALYHLVLDTTALPLDDCLELLVVAARARAA